MKVRESAAHTSRSVHNQAVVSVHGHRAHYYSEAAHDLLHLVEHGSHVVLYALHYIPFF